MKGFMLLGLCFLLLPLVSSQTIVGVSPAVIEFDGVLRGGYAERPITVTVDSDEDVLISLESWGEIASWFNFSASNFTVSRDEIGRPVISVLPPTDVPNGNYTGFVRVASSGLGEGREGHATGIVFAVLDVAITVEIIDLEIRECTTRSFSVDSVEKGDDIVFKVLMKNDGNIRMNPEVSIKIWDQEQVSIVKELDFVGKEILPTREESLEFEVNSDDMEIDQYWAEVSTPECFTSELLTFDVLELGALKADGTLTGIFSQRFIEVGETIPIVINFLNTGEKVVEAQFKGGISREGRIVQILESEEIIVPVDELINFTMFFTPTREGNYVASGRVFYDRKRTFEVSTVIEAFRQRLNLEGWGMRFAYALILVTILFLFFRIRKERRRHMGFK